MNKRNIILIIITIAFALIGLVSVQLYWINNAMILKESNFKRSVSEAVTNTIYRLEKIEIANQIRNRVYGTKHDLGIFNALDSINALFSSEMKQMLETYIVESEENNYASNKISIRLSEYELEQSKNLIDTAFIEVDTLKDVNATTIPIFDINAAQLPPVFFDSMSNQINQFLKKTFIVSDVFQDIFCLKQFQGLQNRINLKLLDSLLTIELANKGINTYYEYGIYNPSKKKFSYQSSGRFTEDLMKKGYAYNLFPGDLFVTPEYFLLYFPYQKKFVLTRMWVMLSVSFALITFMIISFIYSISTIIKQRRLSEMKNDFINNMTHEFKTPVSTIALACEALQDKQIEKSPALLNSYLNIIKEENQRLGSIAENVLQTAIIDKGMLKLKIEEVDIHKVIEYTVKNFSLQIKRHNAKVTLALNADNFIVRGDCNHLSRIFGNLLDNAIKYSIKDPQISFHTINKEGGIMISVKDCGIGISKSNQKKIFDRLYRVYNGNLHNVKGFGLGLNYVKTIVEMHNGKVSVESELNKGSVFSVFLPF
ncbi:MAG: HAMP domain-containing sensor histidine kinase [Bacteroidales bacterium]|nr:HAMP domain-containing sensor histidine kinase [Bacteroidales bacterium]